MYRLQKIQNHAAKVVFRKSKHEPVTPLLKKLHWLPVKERILFKKATFAFRFFDGTLPPYLSSCLSVYTPSCTHRSSSDEKKNIPEQNGNSRALITGRSLFKRPLSGTVFLPTSDTVAPSHSSKLPLRPSSSLLPSPSYLDSLEDLRFFPPLIDCWCLCVADLSVRVRVTGRRGRGGGDWVREWVM